MTVKKTYPKILWLIFSSSFFFIILYLSLYYYTKKVEKEVYVSSHIQFNNEVNKLITLESKPILVAINNDTNWDEFVNFISSKDYKWYEETIATELNIYNADYLGVYDKEGNFIIHTATSKIKSIDFIPKQAMIELDRLRLAKFYMKIPEGLIEVTGASIHTSIDDVFVRKTKPFGYFFVVRFIDKSFIKELEKLTSSKIEIVTNNTVTPIGEQEICAEISLKNYQNKALSKLIFKRKFDVYFENTSTILYLIIIAFMINLIVSIFFTRKWVYYPLKLMARALETGNRKAISKLKETTGEFRHIGKLFEENNLQKIELVKSKIKAEEGDRLKSSFLANLSHEIRTPMNAINGFADLIINTKLNDDEKLEYLKVIEKSGKNLVSIIDDLIEMSKIDSNQIAPNYTNLNLESCMIELFETIKITIPQSKKINFQIIKNTTPAPYNIITDEVKLKQIIVNLVANAIKFTDKGYVAFGYTIDKNNQTILFTIKDSGLGIDENYHKHIFDRFKQVDGDASIKAGGLGLGLAITKAYVEMLGGTISLESKVNTGSVFTFTIPLKYNKIQKITVQSVNTLEVSKGDEDGTILIAEDDNINYFLLQKIMKLKNYTIIRAENGQEAVDICLSNPNIGLVLMDIKMPVMDGYEALEKIKSIRPELTVIAQTAYSSNEDEDKIYKAGFFGYITKPINRERLFELIDNAFLNN